MENLTSMQYFGLGILYFVGFVFAFCIWHHINVVLCKKFGKGEPPAIVSVLSGLMLGGLVMVFF